MHEQVKYDILCFFTNNGSNSNHFVFSDLTLKHICWLTSPGHNHLMCFFGSALCSVKGEYETTMKPLKLIKILNRNCNRFVEAGEQPQDISTFSFHCPKQVMNNRKNVLLQPKCHNSQNLKLIAIHQVNLCRMVRASFRQIMWNKCEVEVVV